MAQARDIGGAARIGEQPVMTDAVKALGQDVEHKAADELVRRQRHHLAPGQAVSPVVLVAEGDAALIMGDKPCIRDGHAVSVARQIGKHRLRPREGNLSILPIIMDLGSRSATPTIRYIVRGAQSCGRRTQKGNAIFV